MSNRFKVAAKGNRFVIIDTVNNVTVKDSLCHNMPTARVIARSMNKRAQSYFAMPFATRLGCDVVVTSGNH